VRIPGVHEQDRVLFAVNGGSCSQTMVDLPSHLYAKAALPFESLLSSKTKKR